MKSSKETGLPARLPRLRRALRVALVAPLVFLAACAGYSGSNLRPGVSTVPEVEAAMGEPALRWREADGREQLAYPRGPFGTQTFMVHIASDGRLAAIEPVLNPEHFARIVHGVSSDADVLRLIGPPSEPAAYFGARDELAWEWRYCDPWKETAFFAVLFDASTHIVRSTLSRPASRGDFATRGCSS